MSEDDDRINRERDAAVCFVNMVRLNNQPAAWLPCVEALERAMRERNGGHPVEGCLSESDAQRQIDKRRRNPPPMADFEAIGSRYTTTSADGIVRAMTTEERSVFVEAMGFDLDIEDQKPS